MPVQNFHFCFRKPKRRRVSSTPRAIPLIPLGKHHVTSSSIYISGRTLLLFVFLIEKEKQFLNFAAWDPKRPLVVTMLPFR